jgi:hypothetical protein
VFYLFVTQSRSSKICSNANALCVCVCVCMLNDESVDAIVGKGLTLVSSVLQGTYAERVSDMKTTREVTVTR